MVKEIILSKGKGIVLVDDEDYEWLSRYKWRLHSDGYAIRNHNKTTVRMHREIMGFPDGEIDHINRNKLDNRKENLRTVTSSQNKMNRPKQRNNTSGINGVSWHKLNKKWQATTKIDGKKIHLGLFDDIEDARKAYENANKHRVP
jgi:hypothetical protein